MRIAGWLFIVCALLGASAFFLPSFETELGGRSLGKRASLSLYTANTNREVARKLISGYNKSSGRHLGPALLAALLPRTSGRLHGYLDDARDALETVGGISDEDTGTVAMILATTVWTFLALDGVMFLLILGETLRDGYRRRRILISSVVALVLAVIAIAVYLVCREAVSQANDELGISLVTLGTGAYLMLAGAIGALGAGIALLVLDLRRRQAGAASPEIAS